MTDITKKAKVTLRKITSETVLEICRLAPSDEQRQFVASNVESIAEAHFRPDYAWFRAIYADDSPVGFVMIGIDPKKDFCFLWRFMIDKRHQKKSFGKKALELVFKHLKSKTNVGKVVTSYHPGKGDPSGFYKKIGFIEAKTPAKWGELGQKMIELGETGLELSLSEDLD